MLDTTANTAAMLPHQGLAPASDWCEVPSGSRLPWCVVATYPQAERRAHASLHRFGLETYLPLVSIRWRNRTWHTAAAFPGYCFVRLDLTRPWSPILYAPGVFQLLSFDGKPATCSDAVVEAVRSAVEAAEAIPASRTRWSRGQPCSLATGPLAGMPAVVTAIAQGTAWVAIMMLGHLREVSVDIQCLVARDE